MIKMVDRTIKEDFPSPRQHSLNNHPLDQHSAIMPDPNLPCGMSPRPDITLLSEQRAKALWDEYIEKKEKRRSACLTRLAVIPRLFILICAFALLSFAIVVITQTAQNIRDGEVSVRINIKTAMRLLTVEIKDSENIVGKVVFLSLLTIPLVRFICLYDYLSEVG